MSRKEKIIITALILFTFFVIVFFVYLLFFSKNETGGLITEITPTPSRSVPDTPTVNETNTLPPLEYESGSGQKVIDALNRRDGVSGSDKEIRDNITSQIGGSGVVFSTSNVRVEYIESADVFHGVILTSNISTAKNEVSVFFTEQGMSQEGICGLPVIFYINRQTAEQLGSAGVTFSPLLDEC